MTRRIKHIPNLRFPQLQGGKRWNVECIGVLFCSFPTASYSRMQLKDKGTIGYIHYGDIHTKYNTFLDLTTSQLPHISEEQRKHYIYLKDGDIILADASEDYVGVGKCIEILNTNGHRAISGLHTILLREKKHYFTEKFKAYLFQSHYVKRQLEIKAVGTKIYSISFNSIRDIRIPYPPISEQKKIADCLSSLDDYINATQEKIELLQAHKKGLMQQLLPALGKIMPQKRLPKFGKSKKWSPYSMEEMFEIRNGYTPSKSNPKFWENGTIPWFRMEDIREHGHILSDSIQHITKEAVKGKGLFPANSIIVATTATIGEHALIIVDSLANQRFTFLTKRKSFDSQIDMKYFYYYMYIIDEWCKQHTNAGGFASVDMNGFKRLSVSLPSIEEQKEIAECFTSIDDLIDSTKQKLVMLQKHKRGLMQQLFPTV